MSNYTIIGGELYHYGVPGMKWGRRKVTSSIKESNLHKRQKVNKSTDVKTKASKGKKVAGIALAAIGTYTVASIGTYLFTKDKMTGVRPIDILKIANQVRKW